MVTFKQFLVEENSEYTDQNIRKIFDKYNKLLFDNELPTIRIRFNRSKRLMASAKGRINRDDNKEVIGITPTEMSISTLYAYDEKRLESLIVHEQIHFWLYLQNVKHTSGSDKSHGIEFQKKKKELEQKLDFKIPDTEDVSGLEINTKSGKIFYFILFVKNNGDYSIMVVSKPAYMGMDESYQDRMERLLSNTDTYSKILIGTSEEPKLEEYPTKRSLKKTIGYVVDKELGEKLTKNMKVRFDIS